MNELRCKPGDLCVVIPGPSEFANEALKPVMGRFVTVTETCPNDSEAWHYTGPPLVLLVYQDKSFRVHAIPDSSLQPIRPSAPSKTTSTWSPKKQTLLTR